MKRALCVWLSLCVVLAASACVHRMAPFAPHRTNTEAHRQATTNRACVECHRIVEIGHQHQANDDCLKCHRIVQGD